MELSIIIPVYNVEPYIEECIRSVYTQDVPIDTYEVIIINDGTKDKSMNIINRYTSLYSNMIVINQKNSGLSKARNAGLNIAKGKYVWFIDSDDWIEENILKRLYQLINKYNADIYATPLNTIKDTSQLGVPDFTIPEEISIAGKEYLFKRMPFGASPRFIMKRNFLLENNLKFCPDLLHEDGEFGPKTLYLAKDIYILRNPIYNYRIRNSNSIMSSWKRKNSDDLIFIYKELNSFCEKFIHNIDDNRKFKIIIFNILKVSILFAKNSWKTTEFKKFYNENKTYIKDKAFNNINHFTIKHFGFRSFLAFIFIYISPLFFLKCKN